MSYTKSFSENEKDQVEYVYCFDHAFIRDQNCSAVAISCRNLAGKASDIGFELSGATLVMRSKMISNCASFNGFHFELLDDLPSMNFSPLKNFPILTAKILLQPRRKLSCVDSRIQNITDEMNDFTNKLVRENRSIHTKPHIVAELADFFSQRGMELQCWPFFLPYSSVCFLYGASRDYLAEDVETFFERTENTIREVGWREFPVF